MDRISEMTWQHQIGEWKQEKRKIQNCMTSKSSCFTEMERRPHLYLKPHVSLTPNLGVAESLYAAKIMEYNQAIGKKTQKVNLINSFLNVATELKEAVSALVFVLAIVKSRTTNLS